MGVNSFFDRLAVKQLNRRHARDSDTTGTGKALTLEDINSFFNRGQTDLGPDVSEITYLTCLKTLSEGVGKMPFQLMDSDKRLISNHDSYMVLNIQANPIQTPVEWAATMEKCRNHFGNAFSYCARNSDGSLAGLYTLDPRQVTIWLNSPTDFTDWTYFYQYLDTRTGTTYWINPADMIHVKSWVTWHHGLVGKSVREIIYQNLHGVKAGQRFLNDLYDRGLLANVAVKYVGDLQKADQKNLVQNMKDLAGLHTDRVLMVPYDWDIETLDMKLVDSQFAELRKASALEIAAAFGVKPNHLNQYDKASYNNSSMQSLSFYVDTLLFITALYEQEMRRKLLTSLQQKRGYVYKADVSTILRGDPTQQAEYFSKLVMSGVVRPNEGRHALDYEPDPFGNDLIVPSGTQKLKDSEGGKPVNGNL